MKEYLVCFTEVPIKQYYSPIFKDEIFFGINKNDVKAQFENKYKNTESAKYYLDEIVLFSAFTKIF